MRAVLLLPALATLVTLSGVAHADEPFRRWDASVALTGGVARVDSGYDMITQGPAGGLRATAAFRATRHLGIAADGWALWSAPSDCPQDASCFNYLAEQQTFLTAGPRLELSPAVSIQLTGGAALSRYNFDEDEDQDWSPAGVAAIELRLPIDPIVLALDLRAGFLARDRGRVTDLGLGVGLAF